MKTVCSILIYTITLFLSAQTASAKSKSEKKDVKCLKLKSSGNYVIDLIALGALDKDTVNGLFSAPNLIELMRDPYNSSVDLEITNTEKKDTTLNFSHGTSALFKSNEKAISSELPPLVQQKLRFSAILCIIILVFIIVAGYTSPLFRKAYGATTSELTPFSLSRSIMFCWFFFILGTIFTIYGSTGNFPTIVISIPYFGGIVFITFLFTFLVEKIGCRNNKNVKFKRNSAGVMSDLLKYNGKICLPRLQYLLVSMLNLAILIIPAWQQLLFKDLPGTHFVIQTISSAVYLGHKASLLQNFHTLIFRKSMRT